MAVTLPRQDSISPPNLEAAADQPHAMSGSNVFAGHRHRLHALEMLLIAVHTPDPALRERYERLSALWLALAERRERLGSAASDRAD
jgi:hypothetical protein